MHIRLGLSEVDAPGIAGSTRESGAGAPVGVLGVGIAERVWAAAPLPRP